MLLNINVGSLLVVLLVLLVVLKEVFVELYFNDG